MRGVILAGGTGSRLAPLTEVTNKHLLPVGNFPMIYYPLGKLLEAGIQEILVVTGTEHMGAVVALLGSGRRFSCQITYRIQDEAGGIAQAIGLAEGFSGGQPIAVVLGDNVFEDSIRGAVEVFQERAQGAHVFLKEVPDPQRFGVARLEGEKVVEIVEKPETPPSDLAVTGVYLYDASVFEIIRGLKPSARKELEVTDVNNAYMLQRNLTWSRLSGWWSDAGTFPSLRRATEYVLSSGYVPLPAAQAV